jgi:hypothetical protein
MQSCHRQIPRLPKRLVYDEGISGHACHPRFLTGNLVVWKHNEGSGNGTFNVQCRFLVALDALKTLGVARLLSN